MKTKGKSIFFICLAMIVSGVILGTNGFSSTAGRNV